MGSKVFILYTGGTFGMRPDKQGDSLIPSTWEELLTFMPAINDNAYFNVFKDVEFTFQTLDRVVDSSHMLPDVWQQIARIIQDNYTDHTGFVIIHGTDTMAYTASALSFVFENLTKPVVITGSQLPIFHPRTDGITNLSNAIHLAAYPTFGLPCVPEVCICFNDVLLRGNRASKSSTIDFEGFSSNNYPPLAYLEQQIEVDQNAVLPVGKEVLVVRDGFSSNVVNVTVFPGYDPGIVLDLVNNGKIDGLVLRTFGSGNIPDDPRWQELVDACGRHEVLILATTQCPNGGIQLGKYEASSPLMSPFVVSGNDISSEAAITKLMWVVGNFTAEERGSILSRDLRGEMS